MWVSSLNHANAHTVLPWACFDAVKSALELSEGVSKEPSLLLQSQLLFEEYRVHGFCIVWILGHACRFVWQVWCTFLFVEDPWIEDLQQCEQGLNEMSMVHSCACMIKWNKIEFWIVMPFVCVSKLCIRFLYPNQKSTLMWQHML